MVQLISHSEIKQHDIWNRKNAYLVLSAAGMMPENLTRGVSF
jgi:hypothetical protein